MLRNINTLGTLTNDKGQKTNNNLRALALLVPTYLVRFAYNQGHEKSHNL